MYSQYSDFCLYAFLSLLKCLTEAGLQSRTCITLNEAGLQSRTCITDDRKHAIHKIFLGRKPCGSVQLETFRYTWGKDTEMELRGMECEGGDYTELDEAVWSVGGFCDNLDTIKIKNFLISKIH